MKNFLAILLLPLLLALPISSLSNIFTSSQNCQEFPQKTVDSCGCASISSQIQSDTCCCSTAIPKAGKSISIISENRLNVLNFDIQIDFFATPELDKKINIFENHNQYLTADNFILHEYHFYSPPIYQQFCSLRI